MNKKLVMWGTFFAVFFISLFGSYKFINRNSQDSTIELSAPTLPLVTMLRDYTQYNTLHGYIGDVDVSDVAKYVYPAAENRELQARIEYFDTEVKNIRYEIRNIDGSRLIEAGKVSGTEYVPGYLDISVKLKDLIEAGETYIFGIKLDTENDTDVGYYTRFVYQDDFDLDNQWKFVLDFHANTFDKEKTAELAVYLEPDGSQDNTSLGYVNIHSSAKQVAWGDLDVKCLDIPDRYITYLQDNYGGYTLDYFIESDVEGVKKQYHVVENYMLSTYGEDIYLLDYERYVDGIYDYEEAVYNGNTIDLSIQSNALSVAESEDGKMAAFTVNGSLYYYDDNENQMSYVYGFFDKISSDPRSIYLAHDIKVLQIDESGSIYFIIYGYMNRGNYEGKTGVGLYSYDGHTKLVEELGFFESTRSPEYVIQETSTLSYFNREGLIFLLMEGNVVSYDINSKAFEVIIPFDREQERFISLDNSCIATKKSGKVTFWNLETGRRNDITILEDGEIIPQGFINNDFVYGISEEVGNVLQSDGTYAKYMKEIRIQDASGEVLKQYFGDGILISDCTISGNQIILERVTVQNGIVQAAGPDQIVARKSGRDAYNFIASTYMSKYQTIQQVKLKNKVNTNSLEFAKAKEIFYEGSRELHKNFDTNSIYYSAHSPWSVAQYMLEPGRAMVMADKLGGYALDGDGILIWKKAATVSKNQIMSIELESAENEKSSLEICMDIMLREIGSPQKAAEELQNGKTCQKILAGMNEDYVLLDITGSSLTGMLYYANKDIPIMVLYDSGEAVLITGFNQFNVVVMDPVKNKLGYMSQSDASEMLQETANQVFTYYHKFVN